MAQIDLLAFEIPRRPVRFYSQTILPNGDPMNYTKNPNAAVLGASDGDDLVYNSPFGTFFQMDDGTYYYKKSKPNNWVIVGSDSGGTGGGDGISGVTNIGGGVTISSGIINKSLQLNSLVGSGDTSVSKVGDDVIIYSSGISNSVGITNVTVSTFTATTSSDFIGASGGSSIFLPNPPLNGQRIIITDVAGDANQNPITIHGNGNQILKSTNPITINTEFGSITLIFNHMLGFWSVIGFTN